MTKSRKNEIVSSLGEEFKASAAVIACSYKGPSHQSLEVLRKSADDLDVKVKVVKNTLATLSIKSAGYEDLSFDGPNIFLWSQDQISACKVSSKFAKDDQKECFIIKTGLIDGKVASKETINTFASLPGREELLGMLLSVWTAPARNFVTGLDNLKVKKEEES